MRKANGGAKVTEAKEREGKGEGRKGTEGKGEGCKREWRARGSMDGCVRRDEG